MTTLRPYQLLFVAQLWCGLLISPLRATPDLAVLGNGLPLLNGATQVSSANGTDFGTVRIAGGEVSHSFVVTNSGDTTLLLSDPTLSGADASSFSIIGISQDGVNGGEAATFSVIFDPASAGAKRATVTLLNNDPDDSPFTFVVEGVGALDPEVAVQFNGTTIADGDTNPTLAKGTDFRGWGVSFGRVIRSFTITNSGAGPLMIGEPVFSGAAATDFAIMSQPLLSIAPASATAFTVAFDPVTNGVRTAQLSFTNNDPDEDPYEFMLRGTGISDAVLSSSPDIQVFGGEIEITNNAFSPRASDGTDFKGVNISNRLGHSDFLITNVGVSNLLLQGLTISGPHAAEFTPTPLGPTELGPGQWLLFAIEFDPAGVGTRSALVSIQNNDPDEDPFRFAIQGAGQMAPLIKVTAGDAPPLTNGSPASSNLGTDLGPVDIRGQQVARTITIENEGSASLMITGWETTGGAADEFQVPSLPAPLEVAAGASTQFDIVFDPGALGIRAATLWISNNVGDPFQINLLGEGIGSPRISIFGAGVLIPSGTAEVRFTDHTEFGQVALDGSFAFRSYVVTNAGDADLRALQFTISGAHATEFQVVQFPLPVVAPGQATSFGITFTPQELGPRTAQVSVGNNAPNENPYTFTIAGGIPPRSAVPQVMEIPRLLSGHRFQLRFGDETGREMRFEDTAGMELQFSPSLRTNSWVTLSNSITIDGGIIVIEDTPDPLHRWRFYRVIER